MRGWLILAAVLGQTSGAAPPASDGSRGILTTRPATTRPTTTGLSLSLPLGTRPALPPPATRPAPSTGIVGAAELSPMARIQVVGDKVIVTGTPQDLAIFKALFEAMEAGPEQEIRLFPLKNAQAKEVAPMLQNLWNQLQQHLPQTAENRVTILFDPLSNTVVVGGTPANIERVGKLIEGIDERGTVGKLEWTPIELKHMRASEAAEVVRQTLEKLQKQKGISGPAPIDVQVDLRHNSLLIIAPQRDIEQIHKLIQIIDQPVTTQFGASAKLAVFPLMKSDAEKLAKTLQDMIALEGAQKEAMKEQIRRLQLLKVRPGTTQPVQELPPLDLEKPIKIIADKGINAVIIGTVETNIPPLAEIISLLDSVPMADEVLVRLFPLKHADAENMAEVLQKLFDKGKPLPDIPGKSEIKGVPVGVAGNAVVYNIDIATDPRTNMLVVAGRAEQIAFAQKIVTEMDIEGIGVKFPVHVLRVQHADPDRLADIITKLNQQRMDALKNRGVKATELERVFVVPDPRTDSIIVSAKEENFKEVETLVAKLDQAPSNYLGDIHILPVKNLTASDLGPKIEQLWQRRIEMKGEKGKAVTDKPVIITDTRSNALVIASNKEDFAAIEALVKQLEDQPLAPSAEIHIQVLKHNDATKLGPQLQDLFKQRAQMRIQKGQEEQPSDKIAIVGDAVTNTMLIACSRETYDELVRLISQLDVPLDVAGVLRMFPLQHTDATRAASLIEDLFTKGVIRPGAAAGAVSESQKKVTVIPDTRRNALIVSATPENFSIIETLIKQVDMAETPTLVTPESRIFQLKYADAVRVAEMLTKWADGIKKSLPKPDADQFNMTFLAEDRSNVVIVTGSRDGMKRAVEFVAKIDQPPGTPSGVPEVYQLKYATASKLADMLNQLFEKRKAQGAAGAVKTPLYVAADDGSNSLIVTASREDHTIITGLLEMLDKPSTLSQLMEIIPLQHAKAQDLADAMTKLLEKQRAAGGAGGAAGAAFTITPEPRTNSLIVFAGPDMMNNIKIITERLDSTRPVRELGLRIIPLRQAKAEDLAKRLTDFLKGAAGTAGGKTDNTFIINFRAKNEAQQEVLRQLVQEDITIAADARTNALLVLAPKDSIDMLETLIQTLDEVKPITAEIQMFLLRNADAEETQKLLEELFNVGKGATTGTRGEAERRLIFGAEGAAAPAAAPGAAAGGGVTTGSFELAFSVDKRTNMLIAAGSPEYLEIVERIVSQLDYLDIQNRKQRLVKLRNSTAKDVAATLSAYFKAEQQALESGGGGAGGGAAESIIRRLERQVTVEPDEISNTVILSYNPRMESQIVEMINKLDQAPPQVMIQVLLAEVTLNNNIEFGMEFALQDLDFTENATTGPNNTIQGSGHDIVTGTDVGAAGSGSLGGFSFTITGQDFNFLLRALQSDGRVDVLSRPSIMVADNQKANITVGSSVPVVQNVNVATNGVVVPSVTYKDVGIILDVEPHINPDGYVNMNIKPEISSIGSSSISIGAGVTLPTFDKRSADTWVTVRTGETIVIGGLITSRENESENKVPFAGDIPLFGWLFKAAVNQKTKTELLIVLTPKVVWTEEDAREVSVKARDQTGLLERIRLSPLMEKLQVKPEEERLGPGQPGAATQPAGPGATKPPAPPTYGPSLEKYGPALDTYGPDSSAIQKELDTTVSKVGEPAK